MRAPSFSEFLAGIEADVDTLRQYGQTDAARAVENIVEKARAWYRTREAEVLTMQEAAEASGYASDTIRKKIATGELPNAGRRNAPRIRRADLPRRKPSTTPSPAGGVLDIEAEARRLAARRSG